MIFPHSLYQLLLFFLPVHFSMLHMVYVCRAAKIIQLENEETSELMRIWVLYLNFSGVNVCMGFQLIQKEGWMPDKCTSTAGWDAVFWPQDKFNLSLPSKSFTQDWTLEGEPPRSQRSRAFQWRQDVLTTRQAAEVKCGHWCESCET